MSEHAEESIIGRAPCGCIRFACVADDPRYANDIAKAIKAGLRIERVGHDVVRTSSWRCESCEPRKRPEAQTSLFPGGAS